MGQRHFSSNLTVEECLLLTSLLLLEIFEEKGLSVRKIMGVASIALHAPVVVELLVEVEE